MAISLPPLSDPVFAGMPQGAYADDWYIKHTAYTDPYTGAKTIGGKTLLPILNIKDVPGGPVMGDMSVNGLFNAGFYMPSADESNAIRSYKAQVDAQRAQQSSGGIFGNSFLGGFANSLVGLVNDLGPIGTIATAIVAPELLPIVAGAQTAAKGGDIGDVLKSAATSYALGQIGQQSGILGDQAAASVQYGTDLNSMQTAMLAAQESGLGTVGDVAGNIAGKAASSVASSALTGAKTDPVAALANFGASTAAPMITNQIEGFDTLPTAAQNAINAVVASEMIGKDPTNALIAQALQAGKNAVQNYSLSDIANIGLDQTADQGTTLQDVAATVPETVQTPDVITEPVVTPVTPQTNITGTPLSSMANQLTDNNQGQPENIGILDSQATQTQAPETQPVQNDVVANTNLQDNQPTASGQGNAMDILDFIGGDTTPDNIDIGGGFNPAGNIYDQQTQADINAMGDVGMNTGVGADLNAMGDVGMGAPSGDNSGAGGLGGLTGGSTGGISLSSILKNILPKTALGQAGLASGVGGVLQGLIAANAANKGAQLQSDAARAALAQQQSMFNTLNQQQAPYRGAGYGALNQIQGMLPGQYTQYDAQGNPMGTATGTGYLTQQFTPELFQQGIDPGYAFRLQQGQMANQRMGNVSGGGLGGNVLKGLQDYTQGQASQEYGNAFNRFQTQRSNIYNTLAGIAGIGQTSQQQANVLGSNLANAQSNLGIGSAAAQAAGQVGQAGAYGGALNSINQALMLSQLPDIAAAMKG